MKTIIFGVSGTVGKALTRTLTGNHYDVYGSYHLRKPSFLPNDRVIHLPVGELDSLDKLLTQVNPDFVRNCRTMKRILPTPPAIMDNLKQNVKK